jgi:hypothetical protein
MTTLHQFSFLMICALACPCNARTADPSHHSARLTLIGGRPVVDGVFLGGKGPFRFLLDTAAESNQLDATIARQLGLTPTFQVEVVTATGLTYLPGAHLPELRLASATAPHQEILFSDLAAIHQLSPDIQGVLGQHFLSRFDYLLDFANHRLTFDPSPLGGNRLPFTRIHNVPAIDTSLGRLLLDSGSDSLVLFGAHSPSPGPGTPTQIVTNAGSATVELLPSLRLKIGNKHYQAANAVLLPPSTNRQGGLLPTSLFRAIYICNSQSYVLLNPDPINS